LLELAHRSSLAQGFVIGIDATAGSALADCLTNFHFGFDLVAHGYSLGHTGHLLPVAIGKRRANPTAAARARSAWLMLRAHRVFLWKFEKL
jgi:hypothetical protein